MSLLKNTAIYPLAQRIATMDEGLIFEIVFNHQYIKDEIIQMNTEDQLFDKGIDSKGESLGEYSPFTIELKKLDGQRYDHITLKDEGDFYKSFRVSVNKVTIEITADPIKDGNNLFDDFGEDIIGLTDESKQKLQEMAVIEYINYWKANILRE